MEGDQECVEGECAREALPTQRGVRVTKSGKLGKRAVVWTCLVDLPRPTASGRDKFFR